MEISHGIRVRFKRNDVSVISVKILYVNILTEMVKWVAVGEGDVS